MNEMKSEKTKHSGLHTVYRRAGRPLALTGDKSYKQESNNVSVCLCILSDLSVFSGSEQEAFK